MNKTKVLGGVVALTAAFTIALPSVASAATVSQADGQGFRLTFFNGQAPIYLNGAIAVNDGSESPEVIADSPVDFSVLGANLALPVGQLNLPANLGSIIQIGTIAQYGAAAPDGSSYAFSGTASDMPSLLGVTTTPTTGTNSYGTPADNAAMAISLGDPATSLVSIGMTASALSASANETAAGVQTGKYNLGDVSMTIGGTIIGGALHTLDTTLVTPLLTALEGFGFAATDLPPDPFATNSITFNWDELAAIAGIPKINEMPPNTNILAYVPQIIAAWANQALTNFEAAIQTAINGVSPVLGALAAPAFTAFQTGQAAALSAFNTALQPISDAINNLAQITVNAEHGDSPLCQQSDGTACVPPPGDSIPDQGSGTLSGAFTQRAIELGLGPVGTVAQIDLASATVGPNEINPVQTPIFNAGSMTVGIVVILMAVAGWFLVSSRRRQLAA